MIVRLIGVALFCTGIMFCGAVSAQWTVEVEWDQMTDEVDASASTKNSEGHRFGIYRTKDGSIRATLTLGSGEIFTRSYGRKLSETRLPIYRVDKDMPIGLSQFEDGEVRNSPEAIGWRVANKMEWPPKGRLADLMSGQRLLVRYTDGDDEERQTEFTLTGAERAVRLAFDLMKK